MTDEPAVLTWMIALAPRPAYRVSAPGRHWWRDMVTGLWRDANDAWELQAEAVALGYETELAEYAAENPRPRLRDFMVELSHGRREPA